MGSNVLGFVCHEEADYAVAINHFERCLGLGCELGDPLLTAEALVHMSRAATLNAEYDSARGFLAQALVLTRQLNGPWHVVRGIEAAALLAARQGNAARAAQLDAATEALGIVSLRPTQLTERRQWIAPLIATLEPGPAAAASSIGRRMSLDEAVAYALTSDGGDTSVRSGRHRLTEREASVLRLLATGYSNSEMAHELILSIHTVERHVANIYAKTGTHGRAEATAYALRHGLAD
jgi:DNA-binding CsgD family transcriptional regulator